MRDEGLTRRAFVAMAGIAALAGCSAGAESAATGSEEDAGPSIGTASRDTGYQWEFITRLGPFDELTAAVSKTPGAVETLEYECHSYAIEATDGVEDVTLKKALNVYLPGDYDPSRTYDVLYLLHGTGGMQDYWLGEAVTPTGDYHGDATQNLLDGMHDQGLFGDVIVIAPTYYSVPEGYDVDVTFLGSAAGGDPYADEWTLHFWKELRNDIIPLVESTYPTHAGGDVSDEGLVASRDHRGFAGLSRGSKTVFNSGMMHCMDLFAWFGCYSGAWTDLDSFREAVEGEFGSFDVSLWYNGNGSRDFSLGDHQKFVEQVLKEMPDRFVDGKNFAWVSFPGGEHAYNCWALDLYNCLLAFFK